MLKNNMEQQQHCVECIQLGDRVNVPRGLLIIKCIKTIIRVAVALTEIK